MSSDSPHKSSPCPIALLAICVLLASCATGCGPPIESSRPLFYYYHDDNIGSPWSPSKQVLDSVGNVVVMDGPRNILVIFISIADPSMIKLSSSPKKAMISCAGLPKIEIGSTRNKMYLVCGRSGEVAEFDLADSEAAAFVGSRANDQGGNAVALAEDRVAGKESAPQLQNSIRKCGESAKVVDERLIEKKD